MNPSVNALKSSIKVLFVEDDVIDQLAFKRLVKQLNLLYEYTIAGSFKEAYSILERQFFHVAILDFELGDGTAIELISQLQEKHIPFIVATGSGDEQLAVQIMQQGAYDYLIKDPERYYLTVLPITVEKAIAHKQYEAQLRLLTYAIHNVRDGIYITDENHRLLFINDALSQLCQCSPEAAINQPIQVLNQSNLTALKQAQEASVQEVNLLNIEVEMTRADGSSFTALLSESCLQEGETQIQVGLLRDISYLKQVEQDLQGARDGLEQQVEQRTAQLQKTNQALQTEIQEHKRTEIRLRESEHRYASLAAAVPVGIFRTDAMGNCTYVNDRWCQITGLTLATAFRDTWQSCVHPDDRNQVASEWQRSLQNNCPGHFECRIQAPNHEVRWVYGQSVVEQDSDGHVIGYVITLTDIDALKQAQELIVHNALHDPLTDLPNRTLLLERLKLAINRAKRFENYRYAVLFLDLDRFKVVNDSLGHAVGDQLLIAIAKRLQMRLRNMDLVARLGGDEFVVLLEDISDTEIIIQIVERILKDCQTPLSINGYEIFTGLSIGIVLGDQAYHQASDLIRDADIAMYQAKEQESNSYKFFDANMHTQILQRLTLETDLRKALEQEELTVYYQPVFNLLENKLVGFEALVRWQHLTRGLIAPDDFVPIAEETGLIISLDKLMLSRSFQQIATWRRKFPRFFPLKVSVNLSAQDLRQASLIQDIDDILTHTRLEGDSINLEITESMLIEDIDQTIELLTQLASRNIQISIDDFGTGYSSLSYLHRLPVHNLKIDRSFVGQMQTGDRNYKVVSTIIALSKQLGLTVVAEGIENLLQLQQLQKLGCQLGQGYLFSKPLEAHEIEKLFFQAP
ncbi:MAG: EAL domain-containing protein [Cyanobacteria bacterium P01_F01_bin.86]